MAQRLLALFELALDFDEGFMDSFLYVVAFLLRHQHLHGHVAGERDVNEFTQAMAS